MGIVNLYMPKMGESIMEGTILRWLKKTGDTVELDEPVLEVATDKVDTEIPSTQAGILTKILATEGQVVAIGSIIAHIESIKDLPTENKINTPAQEIHSSKTEIKPSIEKPLENVQKSTRFYSPLVMNISKQEHIRMEELENITGSGAENRVTKNDILRYIEQKKNAPKPSKEKKEEKKIEPIKVTFSGSDEIIEMDRMRQIIAERMVSSKRISPHVTSFVEADVTNIVLWREKNKKVFQEKYGESLTYTPIFLEAVIKAIQDFPLVNISVDGTKIIKRKSINIGLAVALPTGNLIVPVLKNADKLNLLGLVEAVNDIAKRARENKLKAEDLTEGTYTVSNIGSFGSIMGTPIILQPQVAILALGAIRKKPAVIETPQGDFIGIRHQMFLSHSYDHRVIDGALGSSFAKRVSEYLENFNPSTTFSR